MTSARRLGCQPDAVSKRRWVVRRLLADQRASSDVAAIVVIVPLALAVVLVFVMLGRQGVAAEGVTHAAAVAARAAALERDPATATAAARDAATTTLAAAGTSCIGGPAVAVSASAWAPGGVVSVTVTCEVAGIAAVGASARSVSSSARATIDSYISWDGR